MKTTLEHFKSFSSLSRCSLQAEEMRDFIIDFAAANSFNVKVDRIGNVICSKSRPLVCLQSHYDMVCIGDALDVECYEKDGWLYSKNSTLGADNGIGVALMFFMMERFSDVECLFTADEEVGLIGANNLEHKISSPYLLNLDSEEEGSIFVGCAGGAEIVGEIGFDAKLADMNFDMYEVGVRDLLGGHSGIDIDKGIPNAIKILAEELDGSGCEIVSINGGERINSIPKSATAIVYLPKNFRARNFGLNIKSVHLDNPHVFVNSKNILDMLKDFKQGVLEFSDILKIPNVSINLSTIRTEENRVKVELFARAMDKQSLEKLCQESIEFLSNYGFSANVRNLSEPWKPHITPFANKLRDVMRSFFSKVEFKAIHAGLECGVFTNQQKNLQVASIGPNIKFPHSLRECCEISSILRSEEILSELVEHLRLA